MNKFITPSFVAALFICSALVALVFLATVRLENLDFVHFLDRWINSLDENGLSATLGNQVANYTAPYVVLLDIVNTLIPDATPLTVMHTTGLVLHLFLVGIFFILSRDLSPEHPPWQAMAFAMLVPTSLANGPVWGQSDAFFTGFVLLSFFASTRGRWLMAFTLFSVALSIKLVAIFAAPALLILLSRNGNITRVLWFAPVFFATYLAVNLPYVLSGVSVLDVLGIYIQQAGTYDQLSMWAPNFWYIISYLPSTQDFVDNRKDQLVTIGLITVALLGALAVFCTSLKRNGRLEPVQALWLLSMCALVFPALLPKMHDRYFFLGDVSLWLLASVDRRFLLPALLAQVASLMAYSGALNYLNDYVPWPLHYTISLAALIMIVAIFASFFVANRAGAVERIWGPARAKG